MLNDNIEYYGDAGYRSSIQGAKWSRLHLRPSLRYKPNPLYQFHGGLGLFFIFSENSNERFEFRPWQGFRLNWPSGVKYYFTHRLRFEERISSFNPDKQDQRSFELRMRYKLSFNYDLHYINETNKLYSLAYMELFYPLIDEVDEFFRNRTRTGLGVGYEMFEKYKIELIMNLQRSRYVPEDDLRVSQYAYQVYFHWYWKRKEEKKAKRKKQKAESRDMGD